MTKNREVRNSASRQTVRRCRIGDGLSARLSNHKNPAKHTAAMTRDPAISGDSSHKSRSPRLVPTCSAISDATRSVAPHLSTYVLERRRYRYPGGTSFQIRMAPQLEK